MSSGGYGILCGMPREQNYPAKINARVTWETWRALEWLAANRSVPVGVIIREVLEQALQSQGRTERWIGLYGSGTSCAVADCALPVRRAAELAPMSRPTRRPCRAGRRTSRGCSKPRMAMMPERRRAGRCGDVRDPVRTCTPTCSPSGTQNTQPASTRAARGRGIIGLPAGMSRSNATCRQTTPTADTRTTTTGPAC